MVSCSWSALKGTAVNDTVRSRPVVRYLAGAVAEAEVQAAHFFAASPGNKADSRLSLTCAQRSGDRITRGAQQWCN